MAIFKRFILSVIFVYSYFLDLRATTAFKNLRSFNSKKEIQKTKIYPKITKHKSSRNFDIKINIVHYDSKEWLWREGLWGKILATITVFK